MTLTYPTVFMSHKNDKGYHVTSPNLQCCEADGPGPEGAVEHAREAAYGWFYLEIEEKASELPPQIHVEDIRLEEGGFLKRIMETAKPLPDND